MTPQQNFSENADRLRQQEFARLAATVPLSLATLRSLTPGRFGAEIALMFEQLGYMIITHASAPELIMTRAAHKYLVACALPAQIEATRTPPILRLHAAITAANAQSGFYITTRSFTPEAQAYAATAPLELVDGKRLVDMMRTSKAAALLPETYKTMCRQCGGLVQHRLDQAEALPCPQGHLVAPSIARAALLGCATPEPIALCPRCGAPLRLKEGKRGAFWGCSGFPACRHTAPHVAPKSAWRAYSNMRPRW